VKKKGLIKEYKKAIPLRSTLLYYSPYGWDFFLFYGTIAQRVADDLIV
jgi:hypothetical protein